MTSEEYVAQVDRLMNLQTVYLNIFLVILFGVLGFIGFLQWRLSKERIEKLKQETKVETLNEVKKELGITNIKSFKLDLEKQIDDIRVDRETTEGTQLSNKIILLQYQEDILWRIPLTMEDHWNYLSRDIRNFENCVNQVSGLITHLFNEGKLQEGIESKRIDNIINKMDIIEKNFSQKSKSLDDFKKLINMERRMNKK